MRTGHTLLPMTHELDAETIARLRIRGLRQAKGWSLESLAARCAMSPSTLSRIETGRRRLALDQLVALARAFEVSVDQLVESADDADIVIRPEPQTAPGRTHWVLSREGSLHGFTVVKVRIEPTACDGADGQVRLRVHLGYEWLTVLSGTLRLHLGSRVLLISPGEAAEFDTREPHALCAEGGPVEILSMFDHDGTRAHFGDSAKA